MGPEHWGPPEGRGPGGGAPWQNSARHQSKNMGPAGTALVQAHVPRTPNLIDVLYFTKWAQYHPLLYTTSH